MQVVFDASLLINATAFAGATWLDWPIVPPVTNHAEQDCMGVIASAEDHGDVQLVVSGDLLTRVSAVLAGNLGLRDRDVNDFLMAVMNLATASGGGVERDLPVLDGDPHPAHVAVPLTLAGSGRLLVAEHPDLQRLGPFWGPDRIPILSGRGFADRVDASRRAT